MESTVIVSVISKIEFLGWQKLSFNEKQALRSLLNDCILFELTSEIRKLAIEIRQEIRVKTPDAIIAATAKYLQIPLVTADQGFKLVSGIELILI